MTKSCFISAALVAILLVLCAGCSRQSDKNDGGKLLLSCGLPPVAFLAKAVAGELADVQCLLPQGRSPHDYSPRPQEISRAGKSRIFFTTGMAFENSASAPLVNRLTVCDVTSGIRRRHFDSNHKCAGHHHHHHNDASLDPHIWLSCANAKAMAENICRALSETDPANTAVYQKNFQKIAAELDKTAANNKKLLEPYKGREFFVYHPAFGYFADEAKMLQRPVEINGREATAAQLAEIIRDAKNKGVKTIFVQPQFNPKTAEVLAQKINGKAVALDPLAENLLHNLNLIPQSICQGFETK